MKLFYSNNHQKAVFPSLTALQIDLSMSRGYCYLSNCKENIVSSQFSESGWQLPDNGHAILHPLSSKSFSFLKLIMTGANRIHAIILFFLFSP